MPAAISADDEIIKTVQKRRSGRHNPLQKRTSGKRTDKHKTSISSGKHHPGQRRKSGKHGPNTRGTFKDFVASRAAADKKTIEERDAELNALRKRADRMVMETDASNKRRFAAETALEDAIGRAATRFLLCK